MKRKIVATFLTMVVSLSVFLTGCGATKESYDSMTDSSYGGAMKPEYDMGYDMNASEDYYESPSMDDVSNEYLKDTTVTESGATDVDAAINRKMITTVNMNVETEHFTDLVKTIENQVKALGGYMESYDMGYQYGYSYNAKENLQYANLVIRVPAENLDKIIKAVDENANVINKNSNTRDVTLSYVDIESRKHALEVEYDSILNLLSIAEKVESIITLQQRLTEIRYEIESLESQLRTYDNKVNYSTVYLYVSEVLKITPVITKEESTWDRIGSGLDQNLYDIGRWFKNTFINVVVALPYIGIALVIGLIIFLIVRISVKKLLKVCKEQEKKWEAQKAQEQMQQMQWQQQQEQWQQQQVQNTRQDLQR